MHRSVRCARGRRVCEHHEVGIFSHDKSVGGSSTHCESMGGDYNIIIARALDNEME